MCKHMSGDVRSTPDQEVATSALRSLWPIRNHKVELLLIIKLEYKVTGTEEDTI